MSLQLKDKAMKAVTAVAFSVLPLTLLVSAALQAQTITDALTQSKVKFDFRYRLEAVEQDNALLDATASTLRSRVQITTGNWSGFSALVEVDNVSVLGGDTYNSTANGKSHYSVVADPKGTDLNQAFLRYQFNSNTNLTAGRQLVNHVNQRFIGGVGWRQNEQTLDGYRLTHKFSDALQADVGHYYNVNRIFGPQGAAADLQGAFNTALVSWQLNPQHNFAGFVYDLDFDTLAARSSRTYGIDYQGKLASGPKLSWHLAFAKQQDAHDAPADYSHNYHRVSVNWALNDLVLQAGQEVLGGDGATAFQTPLATLHAFQGFADLFLNTPATGLHDNWLQVSYPISGFKLALAYHKYDSDVAGIDYGDEWNITAGYKFGDQLSGLVKLARYNADEFGADTDKVWLMLHYKI